MSLFRWLLELSIYLSILLSLFSAVEYARYDEVYFVVFLLIFMRSFVPLLVTLGFVYGPLNILHEKLASDPVGEKFLIKRVKRG